MRIGTCTATASAGKVLGSAVPSAELPWPSPTGLVRGLLEAADSDRVASVDGEASLDEDAAVEVVVETDVVADAGNVPLGAVVGSRL
jgi:hypothetical protein